MKRAVGTTQTAHVLVGVRYSQGPLCASSLSSRPACPTERRQLPAWSRANRATFAVGTEGRLGSHARALCCSHMLRWHSEEMQWQPLTSFFSFLKSWSAPDRPFRRPILKSYFMIAAIFLTSASRLPGKIKSSGTIGEIRCVGRNIEPALGPQDQDRYCHSIGSATQYLTGLQSHAPRRCPKSISTCFNWIFQSIVAPKRITKS